jgi:putative transcriptional regulator
MNEPISTDWAALRAMTDDEIVARALTDPDNLPITDEDWEKMKPIAGVMAIRHALRLASDEFSARFGIPLETLSDWEQGRSEPDEVARAYLRVIERAPEMVATALTQGAAPAQPETV